MSPGTSNFVYGSMPTITETGLYKMASGGTEIQLEEEPMYVNAKQYHRILKRRAARAKWDAQIKANKAKVHHYLHIHNELTFHENYLETLYARI
jgi:hypothetical protein